MKKLWIALLVSLPTAAFAGYLSVLESGDILPESEYQFGVAPQLIVSEGSGGNIDVYVDAPASEDVSFRAMAGAGKVDFHIGGSVKFVPFPDVDNQPAIGVRGGVWYARQNSENITTVQVTPLVSRRFDTDYGRATPYIAVPFNITNAKDRNYTGTQFTIGSEWKSSSWESALWVGEVSLNLKDSFSTITLGLAFPFDGSRGFKRR